MGSGSLVEGLGPGRGLILEHMEGLGGFHTHTHTTHLMMCSTS